MGRKVKPKIVRDFEHRYVRSVNYKGPIPSMAALGNLTEVVAEVLNPLVAENPSRRTRADNLKRLSDSIYSPFTKNGNLLEPRDVFLKLSKFKTDQIVPSQLVPFLIAAELFKTYITLQIVDGAHDSKSRKASYSLILSSEEFLEFYSKWLPFGHVSVAELKREWLLPLLGKEQRRVSNEVSVGHKHYCLFYIARLDPALYRLLEGKPATAGSNSGHISDVPNTAESITGLASLFYNQELEQFRGTGFCTQYISSQHGFVWGDKRDTEYAYISKDKIVWRYGVSETAIRSDRLRFSSGYSGIAELNRIPEASIDGFPVFSGNFHRLETERKPSEANSLGVYGTMYGVLFPDQTALEMYHFGLRKTLQELIDDKLNRLASLENEGNFSKSLVEIISEARKGLD